MEGVLNVRRRIGLSPEQAVIGFVFSEEGVLRYHRTADTSAPAFSIHSLAAGAL